MRLAAWGIVVFGLMASVSRADDATNAAFFESKVRPLLIAKCQECHGSEKPKSGLRLDSREAVLTGGESGPAAVSGKPDQSLLMDVISYRNTVQMPPKAKLPESDIATLTEWVRRGLPWPNSKPAAPTPAASATEREFTDEEKSFWAFQPVKQELPPTVANEIWVRSPIDRFILRRLEDAKLTPARDADRRTLLRRVTLDLTGLPPTPDEVAEFVADSAPDALERVIDRLLASPRYGERWGRHWLDVARYADSNGLDENLAYGNAYRYRDYVVKAFREDKPYDRFLIEQIAGDLLEPEAGQSPQESFDALVATGFLCLGAKMLAEDDPVKMQMDIIDEQVDTIARAVMGLTMGCARCHDHKFDPLTAEDYYGLAGVFKSTRTMDTFSVVARWHERPLATASELKAREELQQLVSAQKQVIEKKKGAATETILDEARRNAGAYLLAATRELQLASRLQVAKPRGNEPNPREIAGAILIEAEDYARGNVLKETATYGKGIGVLVNRGETPNFTEYDIDVEKAATYQFELRYAAAGSRPVKVFVNALVAKPDAASKVTGSWNPDTQTWFVECFVTLNAGRNLIRLEQPQFFPHIDKLLLTPIDLPANVTGDSAETKVRLLPSFIRQWSKVLEREKSDSKSVLKAWLDLQEAESGRTAQAVPDPVLEFVRPMLYDAKGPFAIPEDIEAAFPSEVISQLKSDREELAKREAAIPKFPEAMAVADLKTENLKIHLRGSHLTLGREVPHQLPRILSSTGPRELVEGSGRLQLARWVTRPDHPLTSRVMVNRVWQWHFGHGLVRSPDNFGRLGERPSHPALLDWLAHEFGNVGPRAWSVKALHRQLLASTTYRQSTEYNAASALADPENRLLWRSHRQRMDVEVLRDSLLAISGQLDETPGGTLLPTANRAYVTSTANVNPAIYNSNRRAIYLPVVRSALYDVFTAFDFADPSTLAGQREQTTVAPQALFMMNSGFVLNQSQVLARQLLERKDLNVAETVRHLYSVAYSREPSEAEVSRSLAYLDRMRAALTQAGVGASEVELRAWTSLCRAILSANEFVYVE